MTKSIDRTQTFYRVFYSLFILSAIYFGIKADFSMAASQLGIGLIFDPFDHKMPWSKRPPYQKIWLIVHLVLVLMLVVLAFMSK